MIIVLKSIVEDILDQNCELKIDIGELLTIAGGNNVSEVIRLVTKMSKGNIKLLLKIVMNIKVL